MKKKGLHCVTRLFSKGSETISLLFTVKCLFNFLLKILYTTEAAFLAKISNILVKNFELSYYSFLLPGLLCSYYVVETISVAITFLGVLQEGSSNKQTEAQISRYPFTRSVTPIFYR